VLATASAVRLGLFDLQGRKVRDLESSTSAGAGRHVVEWDGRGANGDRLRAGIYFLWLDAGGTRQMRRVVVTR
jgi:flagellar hook assembly protein FlgD